MNLREKMHSYVDLHSNMVLLKVREGSKIKFVYEEFTFQYGSIKGA